MKQHAFKDLAAYDPYGSFIIDHLVVSGQRSKALEQAENAVVLVVKEGRSEDYIIGTVKLYEAIRQLCAMPDTPLCEAIEKVTLNIAPKMATNITRELTASPPMSLRPNEPLDRRPFPARGVHRPKGNDA